MSKNSHSPYEVAVYYFPQYHPNARNSAWHGQGWTEWEISKAARPRYPGHHQPITSAWGDFNEADPEWAAREIDLAADHGITTFLYDWYWYDGKPFLEEALEQGFLAAPNNSRLKFALMWANHHWLNLYPAPWGGPPATLTSGWPSQESFERMTSYVVEHYFSHPNYLTIDGEPYFSIFDLGTFIEGFGGLDGAQTALERFRAKTIAAGFPGLHVNAITTRTSGVLNITLATLGQLHLSSLTAYCWYHFYIPANEEFPCVDYKQAAAYNATAWKELADHYPIPYYPNVSMGWDPSPRTRQDLDYQPGEYPWTAIYEGNTPEAFKKALQDVKDFLDHSETRPELFTINAWNEWTEGSYLLPDTRHGTTYLEAVKEVFGAD